MAGTKVLYIVSSEFKNPQGMTLDNDQRENHEEALTNLIAILREHAIYQGTSRLIIY